MKNLIRFTLTAAVFTLASATSAPVADDPGYFDFGQSSAAPGAKFVAVNIQSVC